MKRLLCRSIAIGLMILFLPMFAYGQCTEQAPCPELARVHMMGGGVPAAGVTDYCASCSGSCIYCEDFENSVENDCGDVSTDINCRYTYDETLDTGVIDFTTSQTTQQCSSTAVNCLRVTRSGGSANNTVMYDPNFAAPVVYLSAFVRYTSVGSLSSGNYKTVLALVEAGGVEAISLQIGHDGANVIWRFRHHDGSNAYENTVGPTAVVNTWYRFRAYFNASEAANGVDFYIDSTQYTPLADTSTYTQSVDRIWYSHLADYFAQVEFDNIRIQTDAYPTCN